MALEPGPPRALVFVEVRSHATGRFGLPEENVDRRKIGRLYRAVFALSRLGRLTDGSPLPKLPWRVDLVLVDVHPTIASGVGGPVIRHLRAITPE